MRRARAAERVDDVAAEVAVPDVAREPTAAELQIEVTRAEATLATAKVGIEFARREYEQSLYAADVGDSVQRKAKIAEVEVAADRAAAAVAVLEARLQAACEVEAEADRRASYENACAAHDFAVKRLREYDRLARAIVEIIRDVAAAEHAIVRANGDLPSGTERIGSPEEAVRFWPPLPERVIAEQRKPAGWFTVDGRYIRSQSRCRAVDVSGKIGVQDPAPRNQSQPAERRRQWPAYGGALAAEEFDSRPSSTVLPYTPPPLDRATADDVVGAIVLRTKSVETVLPAVPGRELPSLASRLVLPGLRYGEDDVWEGRGWMSDLQDLQRQLDRFAARPATPPRDTRAADQQPQVREVLVDEPALIEQARRLTGMHGEDAE